MRALYPGSFDPFTNGHLSVLEQAVNLFDKVVICISPNPSKKRRFSEESCMEAIKDCLKVERCQPLKMVDIPYYLRAETDIDGRADFLLRRTAWFSTGICNFGSFPAY